MNVRAPAPSMIVLIAVVGSCVAGPRCCCMELPAAVGPRTVVVNQLEYEELYYVSQTTGSNNKGDGSRAEPWQTIQFALGEIQDATAKHRVAVQIAAGTYEGATIVMKEYVDLFGGFSAEDWSRDIDHYATTLDGAQERRIAVAANHARLDGFLLQNGAVRGLGGAMLCDGVSPTLTNNRFAGNKTLKPAGWKPKHRHELAHDGGAICCRNGAKPTIRQNLFTENKTEIGRGAAISLHGRCAGEISSNVFLDNQAGTNDSKRSSDGGAISIFDWSAPRIEGNVLLENKALNRNDGGGIFVALWSSPVIARNLFVGNRSTDDGGALFVGGQEHRYDRPKDSRPDADKFHVKVLANIFLGNENAARNSGGMRVAMQARATLQNNILARDARLYVQESDIEIVNNTVLEDVYLREMSQYTVSTIANNVFWGKLRLPRETRISHSIARGGYPGRGNLGEAPRFLEDAKTLEILSSVYIPSQRATRIEVSSASALDAEKLANRVIKVANRWGVVKSGGAKALSIWGDIADAQELSILPTFQLHPESPGVDQGDGTVSPADDFHGDPRPWGHGVDIGADEVVPERLSLK